MGIDIDKMQVCRKQLEELWPSTWFAWGWLFIGTVLLSNFMPLFAKCWRKVGSTL